MLDEIKKDEKKEEPVVKATEVKATEVKIPSVFTDPPERISNPRSPFKVYLVFDYDMAADWLADANARCSGYCNYAVILDEVAWHEGNSDTLLSFVMQAVLPEGTLFVGDAYKNNEFLKTWERKRKAGYYVPFVKP